MYRQKKVISDELNSEFRILSKMLNSEEMDVMRYFKHKSDLKEKWEDKI
jgi:hypothetical protein